MEWGSQIWRLMKTCYLFCEKFGPPDLVNRGKVKPPVHQPLEKDVSQPFWSWRWATWVQPHDPMSPVQRVGWSWLSHLPSLFPFQKFLLGCPVALADNIIPRLPVHPQTLWVFTGMPYSFIELSCVWCFNGSFLCQRALLILWTTQPFLNTGLSSLFFYHFALGLNQYLELEGWGSYRALDLTLPLTSPSLMSFH